MRPRRTDSLRGPGWLWAAAFLLLFVAMAAGMLWLRAPGLLDRPLTDPHPLRAAQSRRDDTVRDAVIEVLEVAGRARLDGEGFTQLVRPWTDRRLEGLNVSVDSHGYAVFDVSVREGASWINLQLVCPEVELVQGRFTRLRVHSLTLSGWDLTPVWVDRDLSAAANEELATARRLHPETGTILDALARVRLVDGRFRVEVPRARVADAFPRRAAAR